MIFTGLRYDTGRDIHNYKRMFDAISSGCNYTDIGGGFSIEISYYLITLLMIKLKLKFQALVLLYSALSYSLLYLSLKNLRISKFETFVYLSVFIDFEFLTYFILMRQFLAASIIFYVFTQNCKTRKDIVFNSLILIIAGLVHTPAFIIIPFYVIFNHKKTQSILFRYIMIFIAILLGISSFAVKFMSSYADKLGQYARFTNNPNYGEKGKYSMIILLLTLMYLLTILLINTNEIDLNILEISNKMKSNLDSSNINSSVLLLFMIYYSSISLSYFNRSYWYLALSLGIIPVSLQREIKTIFKSKSLSYCFGTAIVLFMFLHTLFIYVNLENSDPLMIPYKFSMDFFEI